LNILYQDKEVCMMDIFDLFGKVVIVTGGNQGIGLAISRGLAGAGAAVIIANRRAEERAKYNINVNAIGPGPTITPLNKRYFEENPDKLQQIINSLPLGRIGDTSDYMGAAIFLASESSNSMTGQTLLIEGGSTIW